MNLRRIALFTAAAASALAIAACSGGNDEQPPAPDTNMEALPETTANTSYVPEETPTPLPAENVTADAPTPTPLPDLSADEQTQDDADAAGMTARVSRDEGSDTAGQPAN